MLYEVTVLKHALLPCWARAEQAVLLTLLALVSRGFDQLQILSASLQNAKQAILLGKQQISKSTC